MPVQLPLDHLAELWPDELRGTRVGALLHPASISTKLDHASRILERHHADLFRLSAFFGPQHGFLGMWIVDPANEELGAPDVVRSNRSAMGNDIAQHADARYLDRLSRHVS